MGNIFETLSAINVNDKVEGKNGLNYLSWTYAFAEMAKRCPDMSYEVDRFENGLPYVYDENTGYMVSTKVTVGGQTKMMWLPVMDSANNAMKKEPYEFTTKWGKKVRVEAATMFDINKTIMRCLTKNFAMFGLGLYIYAGEDLPEEEAKETPKETLKKETKKDSKTEAKITFNQAKELELLADSANKKLGDMLNYFKVAKLTDLTAEQYEFAKAQYQKALKNETERPDKN